MAKIKDKNKEKNDLAREYLVVGKAELEDMNKGELLEMCRSAGLPAHRGLDTDVLISILEGEETPKSSPVDAIRDKLIAFVQLYWDRVKNQLSDGCDGNCYGCSDAKAIACFMDNRSNLFRKRRL